MSNRCPSWSLCYSLQIHSVNRLTYLSKWELYSSSCSVKKLLGYLWLSFFYTPQLYVSNSVSSAFKMYLESDDLRAPLLPPWSTVISSLELPFSCFYHCPPCSPYLSVHQKIQSDPVIRRGMLLSYQNMVVASHLIHSERESGLQSLYDLVL